MGVLRKDSTEDNMTPFFDPVNIKCCELCMGMGTVVEVLATFEGPILVDLGIRGHSLGHPLDLRVREADIHVNPYEATIVRFGPLLQQKDEISRLEDTVQHVEKELNRQRALLNELRKIVEQRDCI
ncbi:hypothetical protein BJX76DRAFT_363027 [Aspergillus varians]